MTKFTLSLSLVVLFVVAALARTSPQIEKQFKFVPGQTYIYEYRGRQWNGLEKLADQYAGLTLESDIILQALPQSKDVNMKLTDVKVEQFHTQTLTNDDVRKLNQGKEKNDRQIISYQEELGKPIRFTYLDGKILSFVAEASDPEWSINIKKSILSLFQLNLAPSKIIKSSSRRLSEQVYGYSSEDVIVSTDETPMLYPVYEESFGGICETLYQVDSVDNNDDMRSEQDIIRSGNGDVLNVTKTVNYKNCLTDPSVSFDRHSFDVNTQTIKGKLMSSQPTVMNQNYNSVPEELKLKYSNAYTSSDSQNNVASPMPVDRYSWTKYNITTWPKDLRRSVPINPSSRQGVIEGVYSEGKIKFEANGDTLISETQQRIKLITCTPTIELKTLAQSVPAISQIRQPSQPIIEYQTIQCELNKQKAKFYQALYKFAQLQRSTRKSIINEQNSIGSSQSSSDLLGGLYSHQMVLPFALSSSWYPLIATGQYSSTTDEYSIERIVDPDALAKSYKQLLISLADDVLSEDVAASKRAGEKVVRLVNVVAFMPKYKLAEIHDSIVDNIQKAKQQQIQMRGKQGIVDNDEISKWKVVRKLYIDSLPLAGSKQAIEMIEILIATNRVKSWEAKEMVQAVPANLRYPDTEIIDAFIRISQMPHVRKSRSLFASSSIAVGKMIANAYAKSKDASYKPTSNESADKLPIHLRNDDTIRQVVEEADPRRQLPIINWDSTDSVQREIYDRLILDEQDLTKYVKLYKQLLSKAVEYQDKVVYIETLAHMQHPQVLSILEPYVSGRLSLAQCLSSQPLDISRPAEQSQWYNYHGERQQAQWQRRQNIYQQQGSQQKDWDEEDSYASEECNYMRTITIYALAHVSRNAPSKVQAMLLPVFDNTYEPYQIRIAAFTTMMLTEVDEHILERIASQMWNEPSRELASFVVGTIDTMSKLNAPSMAGYKYAAQKAADSMPKQYLDTWKFSWMTGGDHFDAKKQTGLSWVTEVIKSNVSSIPRAAYGHVRRSHGPAGSKMDNIIELGFTSKGLESLLKEYAEYNKRTGESNIVDSVFENLYSAKNDIVKYYREARNSLKQSILSKLDSTSGGNGKQGDDESSFAQSYYFKRQQPIDGVNSKAGKQSRQLFESAQQGSRSKRSITIRSRSSTDEDEEPKLTIFSRLFDSTSYYALDKKQIVALLDQTDDYANMIADELVLGGKLHYVKMLMPANMWHLVPSQIGLPVVATHRTPIVASFKIDGSHNGQLTSNSLSQSYRQQATGSQIPNVKGHNYILPNSLNITVLVQPKIMHSNFHFLFAVDQSNGDAFGSHADKSHQVSMPMELSLDYSATRQSVSVSVEPKTPQRCIWTKEAAKTYIGQIALATSQADSWLGDERLVRVPSKQANYKRLQQAQLYEPSLLASMQDLMNKPKDDRKEAIEELEAPYKFERRFVQPDLSLEFYLEGATDDEDVVRAMNKPDLSKQVRGQLQWTSTDDIGNLDQHSKSGPYGEYLHILESAMNRPSSYLEFYTTVRPMQDKSGKSPVYRFDFVTKGNTNAGRYQQQSAAFAKMGRRSPAYFPQNNLGVRSAEPIETVELLNKRLNMIEQH